MSHIYSWGMMLLFRWIRSTMQLSLQIRDLDVDVGISSPTRSTGKYLLYIIMIYLEWVLMQYFLATGIGTTHIMHIDLYIDMPFTPCFPDSTRSCRYDWLSAQPQGWVIYCLLYMLNSITLHCQDSIRQQTKVQVDVMCHTGVRKKYTQATTCITWTTSLYFTRQKQQRHFHAVRQFILHDGGSTPYVTFAPIVSCIYHKIPLYL